MLLGHGVPMMGHLKCATAGGSKVGMALQRLAIPYVQDRPLAGKQLPLDDLPDQRVSEDIAVAFDNQQVRRHGGPQRGGQCRIVEAGDLGEQRMTNAHAADSSGPDHALGLLCESLQWCDQEIADR